jgi:hypothetical protein
MEPPVPGQKPDLRINVRDADGHLKELVAVWQQAEKEHLSGKIRVTEAIAELFKPGNEIAVFVFKNGSHPEPKPADPKSRKRATEKPPPRPAA